MCVLPKDGLYPLPLLRRTEEKGTGILILNGPKQRSVDPGTIRAIFGSIVALKATLILSDSEKGELILNNRGQWPQNTLNLINKGVHLWVTVLCLSVCWCHATKRSSFLRYPLLIGACPLLHSSSRAVDWKCNCSPMFHKSELPSS